MNKQKVVVVGESSSLLQQEAGSLIDSFDIVMRTNTAITESCEQYVGTRTDYWYMAGSIINFITVKDINPHIVVLQSQYIERCRERGVKGPFTCWEDGHDIMRHQLGTRNISAGITAIGYWIFKEQYKPVYVAGIEGFRYRGHYYDTKKYLPHKKHLPDCGVGLNHEQQKERDWLDKMEAEGRIKYIYEIKK